MTVKKRNYSEERGASEASKAVWSYAFSYRHQRYRQSGFDTKSQAETAEAKKRNEVFLGGGDVLRAKRSGCIPDLISEYIEYRNSIRAPNTVKHESPILNKLSEYFGKKRISHISKPDVEDYIVNRQRQGQSSRTINIELSVLRCLLEFAKDRRYADVNVGRKVKNLKQYKKEITIPTDEEFAKFIDACNGVKYSKQFSVYIHLRYATGLRPSEAFGLLWSDIDFKGEQIRVVSRENNPLKKGSERFVDMHPTLKSELETWRADWIKKFRGSPPHNWVFYNPQRVTVRAKGFRGAFSSARKKAGICWLRDYDLRHYFISTAIMAGIDYLTIMKWTGHKSSDMIDKVYGHLKVGHSKVQMNKLDFGARNASHQPASEAVIELRKKVA